MRFRGVGLLGETSRQGSTSGNRLGGTAVFAGASMSHLQSTSGFGFRVLGFLNQGVTATSDCDGQNTYVV